MPICFLKKSSGKKAEAAAPAAAEPSKAKVSPPEEAAGSMEHVITPGAEYASQNRRLRNIQMVRYNFDDDLDDGYYYGTQDQMYYPNHGAVVAPPYHHGMRHVSARSLPRPHPHCDCCDAPHPQYSNYLPPPPPYAHYPPALPQRRFSPAPPPWQRFSPAPPPAPWGQFGPRQHFGPPRRYFGPPRPHFGPPRRPFAPPPSYHDYY